MKFVRKHFVAGTLNADGALSYGLKLIYEFWGFCINGGSDIRAPGVGAFAPITPFTAPAGFDSGSTVLLASGSDGSTALATQFFSSSLTASFLPTYVGKHLVTWVSGSESTDDSIYQITQFVNSGVIRVDTNDGGTPLSSSNYAPWFTARTNINWRIVDFRASFALGWVSGSGMVLQMPGASEVNPGQATPQVRIGKITTPASQRAYRMWVSPSGSWTGTTFTDGDEFRATTANSFSQEWGSNSTTAGYISLTGDRTFLNVLMLGRDTDGSVGWFDSRCGLFIEVPQRLYAANVDPNPLCACIWAEGIFTDGTQVTGKSQTHGVNNIHMVQQNGLLRSWLTMLKCFSGLLWDHPYSSYMGSPDESQSPFGYNPNNNKIWLTSAVLSQVNNGQFALSRVRIRNLAFGPDLLPNGTLVGSGTGGWIKWIDHVYVPWDGARLPYPYLV
jgi:hypothetical protein